MFILLLSAGTLSLTLGQPNPHLPYRWELRRFMDNKDGRIVLTFSGPLGGDPPHFIVSLCDLAPVDPCGHAPILLGVTDFYMCQQGDRLTVTSLIITIADIGDVKQWQLPGSHLKQMET